MTRLEAAAENLKKAIAPYIIDGVYKPPFHDAVEYATLMHFALAYQIADRDLNRPGDSPAGMAGYVR